MADAESEVQDETKDAPEPPAAPPEVVEEKHSGDSKEQASPPTEARVSSPEARVSATPEPRGSVTPEPAKSVTAEERVPSATEATSSPTQEARTSTGLDTTASAVAASASVVPETQASAPAVAETGRIASTVSAKKTESVPTSRRASVSRKSVDLIKEKSKSQTSDSKAKTDSKQFAESKAEVHDSKDVISMQESKRSILSLGPRTSKDVSRDMFARRKSSRSIGKAVGSIISFRRGSIAEYFDRQKTAKFMNTFKLDSEKPFNVDKVEKILKEVLIEALDNLTYDPDKVPKQAKWASSVIRAKVKEQEYDRYKLICIVTIGEKRSQDMYATYRFLWDTERDKHACYIHENMYVFAVAMCFGIYYE